MASWTADNHFPFLSVNSWTARRMSQLALRSTQVDMPNN